MDVPGGQTREDVSPKPIPKRVTRAIANVPIQVLFGRHDVFLPPARLAHAIRRRIPNADFRVVEDAGHLLPHERPDLVIEATRGPSGVTPEPKDRPPSRNGDVAPAGIDPVVRALVSS